MTGTNESGHSNTQKITLIVLGLLLLVTVFLLPHFVTDPWVAGDAELPEVPEASPSTVAPSTAAELTRYRQESQSVLAEVIAARDRLKESSVERWADADFQQILAQIEAGDERYSYGDYGDSLEQFRDARERLAGLEELGRQKLADGKSAAAEAIESLNLNTAAASIELANYIAPQDPEVQALSSRVDALPQVIEQIESGDDALAHDRYQEARAAYRKAVDLDPAHRRASESLARANREVTASVFRGHMSRGFGAMERGDFDGARAAFRQAGEIRPGDPAVEKALAQVANLESGDVVTDELARAAELAAREEWREAVTLYETLLQQDPSLTDARVQLIPAKVRADLDRRLSGFIEEPLRLSSKAEFQAAQGALADARGIPNPGPRLRGQIEQLDTLIRRANSPVEVVFRSDNQTHVVLFRVADLGQFDQKSVQLRPGKYVAAGTRSGYRDVRVEFTVTGEPLAKPIVIRCDEPIG